MRVRRGIRKVELFLIARMGLSADLCLRATLNNGVIECVVK